MRAILKTNNPVTLSYAAHVLHEAGIESEVFDENASVMDGSTGFMPRRLMVPDEDFPRADRLLREAVPEAMPEATSVGMPQSATKARRSPGANADPGTLQRSFPWLRWLLK
jgi:hypothetical protein